jgi:hypothetical protein
MITYVVLLLVEAQDVGTPLPGALVRAAQEALGKQARVEIRAVERERDADATLVLARAREEGAAAVARLTWDDPQRLRGRLEVTVIASGSRESQALAFDDSDPLIERGRAFGLVLAALLRPDAAARDDAAVAARPPPDSAAAVASGAAPAPTARWALDAGVEGGVALGGGNGSGAGGTVGVRWLPSPLSLPRVSLRLGARARFGEVGEAQSALSNFAGSAGVVAAVREARPGRRVAVAVRADALLLYESLSHLSSDDPAPVRQARLMPGAALLGELRWSLSPTVALSLAAGAEVAFGTTHVFVREVEVAELAPVRAVIQGGLVAAF